MTHDYHEILFDDLTLIQLSLQVSILNWMYFSFEDCNDLFLWSVDSRLHQLINKDGNN